MIERAKKRKARESFGAIRTLPSGRIQASYTGPDGDRHNAPRTFDNLTDARGWIATQMVKIREGNWQSMETIATGKRTDTLGTYATEWLETRTNRHGEHLLPRTRTEYERLLRTALEPLADTRLNMLTPERIRTWYGALVKTGAKTQAARAYGFLRSVLGTAVSDGRITSNPCVIRGAQNASTGRKVIPPTPDELQQILDAITPRYRAAVIIAAWGGCRFGEMTELRRKDIRVLRADGAIEGVIVEVSRAVTHVAVQGFVIGKTKSAAGVRSIVLPPHVHGIVLDHIEENVGRSPEALLFPAADGTTHLAQSTFAKHWYPARKAAKREDMPWHALRHYGATRAALAGATLKELQERLGHSTVAAAMRYQHTAGRDADLARRMSEQASA